MERRYLVATLALVTTFVVFSQAFGAGRLAKVPRSRAEAQADIACVRRTVAERIVAKLEPYLDSHAPEQAQMVAELNLPELAQVQQQVDDAQRMVQAQVARQKCQAAVRAQRTAQQVYQMQILSNDRAQRLSDLAIVRAENLSARAQEWREMADTRRIRIDVKAMEHAQQLSVRAFEQAQRSMERSRMKLANPQPGMPIHINFVAPTKPDITVVVPPTPDLSAPTIY